MGTGTRGFAAFQGVHGKGSARCGKLLVEAALMELEETVVGLFISRLGLAQVAPYEGILTRGFLQ